MEPGFDILGAAHPKFPLKMVLRQIPKTAPLGFFWFEFGDARAAFKQMIKAGFTVFRIQIWWGGSAHAIVTEKKLREGLKQINKVLNGLKNPAITLYISHSCEHNSTKTAEVQKRMAIIREMCPNAIPVNNPWRGVKLSGELNESHGSAPGAVDLASTDGTNIYDIDAKAWVEKYGNRKHPCFLWGARFNLREISKPGQNPPAIKNRKAIPDKPYVNSIVRLASPYGTAPSLSESVAFRSPNIWKTHAEDTQEPNENTPDNARENRPTLIIKPNVPSVDILASNGKSIGKLVRYGKGGDFKGGLTRYYSGMPGGVKLYGFQIGNKAKKLTGSEFVWFKAGNKIYGPVNPAFRAGVFRD